MSGMEATTWLFDQVAHLLSLRGDPYDARVVDVFVALVEALVVEFVGARGEASETFWPYGTSAGQG